MGQVMNTPEERVVYNEIDENGMIFANQYIPPEILTRIFVYYTDGKSLLNCQLVCRHWQYLLESYVWHKKAELANNCSLPPDLKCTEYYLMYKHKPFTKNLIKNPSGEELFKHWTIIRNSGDRWKVETAPVGTPPLPEDPLFENSQHCFVTSYSDSSKQQIIDLVAEGVPESILDDVQPVIDVSECYSCRFDCPAKYEVSVQLLDKTRKEIDVFYFNDELTGEKQNVWLKMHHKFKNYGKGVRFIRFLHSGVDRSYWRGHYGSKMARASVRLEMTKKPFLKSVDIEDDV